MTALMDREMAELIVAEVANLWPVRMDELERERWLRLLRPPVGAPLDPELAGQTLLHFRHSANGRPTAALFASVYEALAARARTTGNGRAEAGTDPSTALAHIADLRLILARGGQAAPVLTMAGRP